MELFIGSRSQGLTGRQGEGVNQTAVGIGDLRTDIVVLVVVGYALGALDGDGHGQGRDRRGIGEHERLVIVPAREAVGDRRCHAAAATGSAGGRNRQAEGGGVRQRAGHARNRYR